MGGWGAQQPRGGQGLLIHDVSRSHTTTHHSRYDSSGRVISWSQRPLPDNTPHSQGADIYARGGIRTHSFSRRAATDLRLQKARPLGPAWSTFRISILITNTKQMCEDNPCGVLIYFWKMQDKSPHLLNNDPSNPSITIQIP